MAVIAADAIREAFGCAVLIVHHCGIEGSRPRGHTSLTGVADSQLSVRRNEGGTVVVTVECLKDGAEGDVIAFRLERVVVGIDEDGDEISSCIVVPLNEGEATIKPPPKLSDNHALALRNLAELAAEQGAPIPAIWGMPNGINAVPVETWRSSLLSRGVIHKGDDRRKFWNMKDRLKRKHLLGERDGLVWSARSAHE
jgi:hypothetical protein